MLGPAAVAADNPSVNALFDLIHLIRVLGDPAETTKVLQELRAASLKAAEDIKAAEDAAAASARASAAAKADIDEAGRAIDKAGEAAAAAAKATKDLDDRTGLIRTQEKDLSRAQARLDSDAQKRKEDLDRLDGQLSAREKILFDNEVKVAKALELATAARIQYEEKVASLRSAIA